MGRIKESIRFKVYSALTLLSPKLSTTYQLWLNTKQPVHLDPPRTFAEKISWLKLNRYGTDPLVRQCADKYLVRAYVSDCGYGHLLNELLGVYDRAEDVPWDALPDSFVLKWNFGCGYNLLCKDTSQLSIAKARRLVQAWKHQPYWTYHAELQYKGVKKRLIMERYLHTPHDAPLIDYKLYTFHGVVRAILVIQRQDGKAESAVFMTPDWTYLSDIPSRYASAFTPVRPACLEEMIAAAQVLCAPFPFVRMDFYEYHGKPIFGEMTFTPAAGINPSQTLIDKKDMGAYIHIDENRGKQHV